MSNLEILSPHYDDAALSCWTQIETRSPLVITLFGGAPPTDNSAGIWDKVTTRASAHDTVKIRQAENEAALVGTNATTLNLPFAERQYALFKRRDVGAIADTVEKSVLDEGQILSALGHGTYLRHHLDHHTTRKVGLELMQRGHNVSFYIDLPYSLPLKNFDQWPKRLDKEKIKRLLDSEIEIEPVELTTVQQQRKQNAVKAFGSQYPMVNLLALGTLGRKGAYGWEAIVRPI